MNNQILEKAKIIARHGGEKHLEQAENILLEYLKDHMTDTNAWLLLTTIECNPPLYDYDRITHYAGHVLSYDPANAYALLFLAFADHYLHGAIKAETYDKLCLGKSDDPETMAMIEVAKSRYFEYSNVKKYEEALKKSIEYSQSQQINLSKLGALYIEQGKIEEGKSLIKQAINNVKSTNQNCDPTSMEGWYNYYYKGIEVISWTYNYLTSLLNYTSK